VNKLEEFEKKQEAFLKSLTAEDFKVMAEERRKVAELACPMSY
jgi:hypothetical protein